LQGICLNESSLKPQTARYAQFAFSAGVRAVDRSLRLRPVDGRHRIDVGQCGRRLEYR
jgi:hypothetical protein